MALMDGTSPSIKKSEHIRLHKDIFPIVSNEKAGNQNNREKMYDSEISVYLLYNMNMKKVLFTLLIMAGQSILYVPLNDLMVAVYTAVVHAPSYKLNWGYKSRICFL
jgi:hypothetical protein